MWVAQWYCIFEGLVEMCLITKMMGVVCEIVAGIIQGVVFIGCWSQTLLIENVCIH